MISGQFTQFIFLKIVDIHSIPSCAPGYTNDFFLFSNYYAPIYQCVMPPHAHAHVCRLQGQVGICMGI